MNEITLGTSTEPRRGEGSPLEEALKPFWETQDRFYENNKHLTMRQLVEKIEGRPYDSVE
jgi:hypothetical protein